ncbi:MAG: hypothetical protein ACE5G1_15595 [bacterium]
MLYQLSYSRTHRFTLPLSRAGHADRCLSLELAIRLINNRTDCGEGRIRTSEG